jgi:DNA-binding response OmpR family regulator
LLLTNDAHVKSALQQISRELGLVVETCDTIEQASQAVRRTSFDAAVVDCDDLHGGAAFLREIRRSWTTKNCSVVALLNGATASADALDMGADTIVEKSQSRDALRSTLLSVCRVLNRRGDHRVALSVPVWVTCGEIVDRRAQAFNISEGGIGLRFEEALLVDDVLSLRFELPNSQHRFRARGEIAWAEPGGRVGIRFLSVSDPGRAELSAWLARQRTLSAPAPALPSWR